METAQDMARRMSRVVAKNPSHKGDNNDNAGANTTAGNMWKIMVKPGDKVKAGDTLFIMEVMKMEVNHVAPEDGEVKAVHAEEGQEGWMRTWL